eukprot:TRINITY_DN70154_c0_g1_i1.p2 TRINITY_DN70154_c0_g1~~TRINITY_DN70154_c0_g1_i1.p2  ORF type:complete len:103 (+),score=0.77 TRINITY_DN70154_c0_g1_i1:556-864(+)
MTVTERQIKNAKIISTHLFLNGYTGPELEGEWICTTLAIEMLGTTPALTDFAVNDLSALFPTQDKLNMPENVPWRCLANVQHQITARMEIDDRRQKGPPKHV